VKRLFPSEEENQNPHAEAHQAERYRAYSRADKNEDPAAERR
jgi:hypothetical protein